MLPYRIIKTHILYCSQFHKQFNDLQPLKIWRKTNVAASSASKASDVTTPATAKGICHTFHFTSPSFIKKHIWRLGTCQFWLFISCGLPFSSYFASCLNCNSCELVRFGGSTSQSNGFWRSQMIVDEVPNNFGMMVQIFLIHYVHISFIWKTFSKSSWVLCNSWKPFLEINGFYISRHSLGLARIIGFAI